MPRGFEHTDEVQLHKPNALISAETSRNLQRWWFAVHGGSSPTWDLVSQCAVESPDDSRRGVLLVEAKAHSAELERAGKKPAGASDGSRRNHQWIGNAIDEANVGLWQMTNLEDWRPSRDHWYQTANRFAWAWKLADLGVPVVLVYLGFLADNEMSDQDDLFADHADWEICVKSNAKSKVPEEVRSGSGPGKRLMGRSWCRASPPCAKR